MPTRARAYRCAVLPDKRVGQVPKTAYNANLRGGWYASHVPDEACRLLDSLDLALTPAHLRAMKQVCYLVGVLELPTPEGRIQLEALTVAGFSPLVVIGTRRVQGLPYDSPQSYFRALQLGFDHFKLVKGALCVAELSDVHSLPRHHPRRRKVVGHARHAVLPILQRMSFGGPDLAERLTPFLDALTPSTSETTRS